MTVEAKAVAVAKRDATRQARGTTSKKQKLAVKGDVTGVVLTPVTAPAPATPAPQPVTTTASGTPAATAAGIATK
jgi:hypothetical protein